MADGYWRYADPRQQVAVAPPPSLLKRPRSDYGGAPEMLGYYPGEEDRTMQYSNRDTETINASYDRYIHNGISHVTADPTRLVGQVNGRVDNPHIPSLGSMGSRTMGYVSGRTEASLPEDASNTLFVEGLPSNCTIREASHIFRPFVGFQEVRLVNKEAKRSGGDPLVLCFVDFVSPGQAAVALNALQGYKFDEHDRESASLRLQFARFPGRRSFSGPRSKR